MVTDKHFCAAMERADQRGELLLWNILQLVDHQHDGTLPFLRRLSDRDDEIGGIGGIGIKVAAVGETVMPSPSAASRMAVSSTVLPTPLRP